MSIVVSNGLCDGCARRRPKLEPQLAEQGLVECKLKDVDSTVVMEAFYRFSATRTVFQPFEVHGVEGADSAWPFQFHPSTIRSCAGFSGGPKE